MSDPRTAFGLILAALRRRRQQGIAPFTVLSCDNIQGNGHIAKTAFVGLAQLQDAEFAQWVASSVHFPSSMVDRVTPVTTEADRAEVRSLTGVDDLWPVVAEPYFQWVVEDDFPTGRPPLEAAGVEMVNDVGPYELMKLRSANLTHQTICYFGTLLGLHYAHEALQHPDILQLVQTYLSEEALPTLQAIEGVDLPRYQATLVERFSNPDMKDTLARLRAFSSDRIRE